MADYRADNHRRDFETCPACGHKTGCSEWESDAITMTVSVIGGKHGDAVVMSECAKCGASSWVHHDLEDFDQSPSWPQEWTARASATLKRRRRQALFDWGEGICWKCKHLETANISTVAWRYCKVGSGPAVQACPKFADLKKTTDDSR